MSEISAWPRVPRPALANTQDVPPNSYSSPNGSPPNPSTCARALCPRRLNPLSDSKHPPKSTSISTPAPPSPTASPSADVGPYEKLVGRVDFTVDPDSPAFSSVVDIEHAQRNTDGLVEYSTDFFMLKPTDMSKGNRRLVYDVNNRGTKLLVHFLNDALQVDNPDTPEDAGNGFLMRRGYTVLWSGWQGDLLPGDNRMAMHLPVASMNGAPITGPVRTEFSPGDALTKLESWPLNIVSMPLSGNAYTQAYTPASLDTYRSRLHLPQLRDRPPHPHPP